MTTINDKPTWFRIPSSEFIANRIDKETRMIKGLNVLQRGEAVGHGIWLDSDFLDTVAKMGNQIKIGVKSRFSHPGLSGDGLGKFVGRAKLFESDGNKVVSEFRFSQAASKSPEGDLPAYLLALAEEDPRALGMSLVFSRDMEAEAMFNAKHSKYDKEQDRKVFHSPDELNTTNIPHAKIKALHGVDFVDEGAATADGLFSFSEGSELAARADAFLSYVFGLTEIEPPLLIGGPHPERAKSFVNQFLSRNHLQVVGALPEESKPVDEQEIIESLLEDHSREFEKIKTDLEILKDQVWRIKKSQERKAQ